MYCLLTSVMMWRSRHLCMVSLGCGCRILSGAHLEVEPVGLEHLLRRFELARALGPLQGTNLSLKRQGGCHGLCFICLWSSPLPVRTWTVKGRRLTLLWSTDILLNNDTHLAKWQDVKQDLTSRWPFWVLSSSISLWWLAFFLRIIEM